MYRTVTIYLHGYTQRAALAWRVRTREHCFSSVVISIIIWFPSRSIAERTAETRPFFSRLRRGGMWEGGLSGKRARCTSEGCGVGELDDVQQRFEREIYRCTSGKLIRRNARFRNARSGNYRGRIRWRPNRFNRLKNYVAKSFVLHARHFGKRHSNATETPLKCVFRRGTPLWKKTRRDLTTPVELKPPPLYMLRSKIYSQSWGLVIKQLPSRQTLSDRMECLIQRG